ncbi:hypothetical protein HA402_005788 [Bradysia odoriphaga]|nr:hypothetical protein HA402_005788 [Bradysia odoriphaga]
MNLKLDIDPHSVCRICLSQKSLTNNLINFFSNVVVEGYIISVADMVMKCLDIESDANDGLPDKICDVCKREITNFHLFKEKSARTEKILLNEFDKPPRKKEPNRRSSVEATAKPQTATVGIQTVTEHPSFTCLECKMIFKTETMLSKHISGKHSSEKTEAGCQTDEVSIMPEEIYIDEIPESVEMNYKREMKMELLEVEDIDMDDINAELEEMTSEHKSDYHEDYEIIEKEQEEYQCNDCLEIFPLVELFENHKCPSKIIVQIVNEAAESDDMSDNYGEDMLNEDDCYECYRCHATFANVDEFSSHRSANDCQQFDLAMKSPSQRTKPEEYHHCSLCKDKRFKTKSTFNQHQKLHESIERVIEYLDCSSCDDCHKMFLTSDDRMQHECPKKRKNSDGEYIDESCTDYQYLEPDVDFSCDKCPMEFTNVNIAKLHVITHAKEFFCPFRDCGCSYEIWSRFAMHLSTKHLNEKHHQCKFCDEECHSFDDLQAHYKDRCPEKKFKCDHCDKSYFSQKALNLHIKDITKGKTFNCTHCSKSFNRRGELDLHNRSHTNERPYKCTICDKAYKTSSMRAAHMDAHIEGKTFPCTMCDKKLQTRTSYRNHMKRHTEEKKHQCEHCGKKFFTKFHVKLHASKIHAKGKYKPLKVPSNVIQIEYEDIVDTLDDEQVVSSYG